MAEEDAIQYTTFTGENRSDDNFRNRGNVKTSREIDNRAKFTDWKSKKYAQVKGSEIIKNYNIENFKSSLNKSINLDIDPDKIYWFHRQKGKVGGLTSLTQEKEIVKKLENAKLGGAVENIAKNLGIQQNFIDDAASKYNINPKVLGGVLARGGAGWLDPVSEALEVTLGKVGLPGIAMKWVRGEMLGLVASAIAGVAAGAGDYIGRGMAPAVQNLILSGYADRIPDPEPELIDSLITGLETFAQGTEMLPSSIIAEKTAPVVDPMKDKIKNVFGAFK